MAVSVFILRPVKIYNLMAMTAFFDIKEAKMNLQKRENVECNRREFQEANRWTRDKDTDLIKCLVPAKLRVNTQTQSMGTVIIDKLVLQNLPM